MRSENKKLDFLLQSGYNQFIVYYSSQGRANSLPKEVFPFDL